MLTRRTLLISSLVYILSPPVVNAEHETYGAGILTGEDNITRYTIAGVYIELNQSNKDIHVFKDKISVFSRQTNDDGETVYNYFDSVVEEFEDHVAVTNSALSINIIPRENQLDLIEVSLRGIQLIGGW
jgi:hypothetical protein